MRNQKVLTCALAVVSITFLGGTAFGQNSQHPMDQANPGQTDQGKMNNSGTGQTTPDLTVGKTADATFAGKAAAGGMAEVKLGELAQEKGSSPEVKDFGKRMETDHTKAGDELKQTASRDNIALPGSLDAKDQDTYDRLSKLSDGAFDRAYMRDMVRDHEEDIASFKREADAGKNPDMKSFASETLPTLQDHLRAARKVAKSVGATAGSHASVSNPAQ